MTKQKRGLWLFLFSLLPGAGEMYMGFRKQGISIMGLFFLVCGAAGVLNTGLVLCVVPVIWFYSFFNVHNLKSLSEEEFYSIEDTYILNLDSLIEDKNSFIHKYRNVLAVILILLGAGMLWNVIIDCLYGVLPDDMTMILNRIGYTVPNLVVAGAIIWLGVHLIKGKKKELGAETFGGAEAGNGDAGKEIEDHENA